MTSQPASAALPPTGSVGLLQGSALYIAAVLGTGILVLPALAAAAAGPASILAVLIVLALSVPLAGTFAALAARFPDAGGVASFVRRALGATAARMAGYWFFFGVAVGVPVVAVLGGEYVVAPLGGPRWLAFVVAGVLMVPPFLANLAGLRLAAPIQLVLTGALVAIVVLVVAASAPTARGEHFTPFLSEGWRGVGAAISLFVWAFAGWEAVTHIAGEFRDPRRTIPRATAIAVATVGVAYLALQLVTVAVLGDRAGSSRTPLVDLVDVTLPGTGRVIVAGVAGIVVLGVLNAYLGAFAKLGAALGRDGDLPRVLAIGAESGGVPRRALGLVAVLAAAYFTVMVASGGDLTPFILVHTSSMVLVYALGVVAAVRLLPRFGVGWWLAAISCILVAGLVLLAGANLLIPGLLAVAAIAVTLIRTRSRARGVPPPDPAAAVPRGSSGRGASRTQTIPSEGHR